VNDEIAWSPARHSRQRSSRILSTGRRRGTLAKLREQTTEFDTIASKATDADKHELFTGLAEHFLVLACELEKAIAAKK
jgi:hypothetical protein